jgi:hypothetical protein
MERNANIDGRDDAPLAGEQAYLLFLSETEDDLPLHPSEPVRSTPSDLVAPRPTVPVAPIWRATHAQTFVLVICMVMGFVAGYAGRTLVGGTRGSHAESARAGAPAATVPARFESPQEANVNGMTRGPRREDEERRHARATPLTASVTAGKAGGSRPIAASRESAVRSAMATTAAPAFANPAAAARPDTLLPVNIVNDDVLLSIDPDVEKLSTRMKVSVSAAASDPDGDPLTFTWSAPTGAFSDASARQTTFLCPITPGTVPVTVTVTDGRGGVATDTIAVHCMGERQ